MSGGGLDQRHASRRTWWLMVIAGTLTLLFGTLGVCFANWPRPEWLKFFDALYDSIEMLLLHAPHFQEEPNLFIELGCYSGVVFVFLAGLELFGARAMRELRLFFLTFRHKHVVICGLGEKGIEMVRCRKRNSGQYVVAIDPHPSNHVMEECARLGVALVEGDAIKPATLVEARVAHASEVIVITTEDETNVRIAACVQEVCMRSQSTDVNCYVHLTNIHLRERLQLLAEANKNVELHFFDVFDSEARRVLTDLPLDGDGLAKGDRRSVHVAILGFGRMGRSLALRAAKMGHFANRKPLRISIVSRDAKKYEERFLFRYPALHDRANRHLINCEINFLEHEVESIATRELVEKWAAEPHTIFHVFICVDDNSLAVEVVLRLQEALVHHPDLKLHVRIKNRGPLAKVLEPSSLPLRPNQQNPAVQSKPVICVFGAVDDECLDLPIRQMGDRQEDLAMAIHKRYVEHRLHADPSAKDDPAVRPWKQLHENLRESNRQQADHIGIKLRAIGCELVDKHDKRSPVAAFTHDETKFLAQLEHERWNAERLLAGWTHGTKSDKPKRVNKNICGWDALDEITKRYDEEAVDGILKVDIAGSKVVRK